MVKEAILIFPFKYDIIFLKGICYGMTLLLENQTSKSLIKDPIPHNHCICI